MNLIIKERIKQIATLKVVGQNIFQITLSILIEISIICLVGLMFGMLIAYPLMILVLSSNKVDIMNFIYYISPLSFIFAFLIIIGVVLMMSVFSLIKIKKVSMVESLKTTE